MPVASSTATAAKIQKWNKAVLSDGRADRVGRGVYSKAEAEAQGLKNLKAMNLDAREDDLGYAFMEALGRDIPARAKHCLNGNSLIEPSPKTINLTLTLLPRL